MLVLLSLVELRSQQKNTHGVYVSGVCELWARGGGVIAGATEVVYCVIISNAVLGRGKGRRLGKERKGWGGEKRVGGRERE